MLVVYQVCVPSEIAASPQYTASGQRRRHKNASVAKTIRAPHRDEFQLEHLTRSQRYTGDRTPPTTTS